MTTEPAAVEGVDLPRLLGPTEAICMIVGSVIGSGIFIVPASVALGIGSIGGIAAVWIVGGLFSLAGALTLAELGGDAAAGPGGPTSTSGRRTGRCRRSCSAGRNSSSSGPGPWRPSPRPSPSTSPGSSPAPAGWPEGLWQMAAAVAAISILAAINVVGTGLGGRVQVIGTALKLGALAAMISLPFALGRAARPT